MSEARVVSMLEAQLTASIPLAKARRQREIEGYLDTASATLELARTALRRALAIAKTVEGREALTEMLAKLGEISDDRRADRSSGEMCAAYEAEVGT